MALQKWTPTTDQVILRRLGKLVEELGELQAVAGRCIIQGVDEIDPSSGKVNRARLEQEIADVAAQLRCTTDALCLNKACINARISDKWNQMQEWEDMFSGGDL